MSDPAIVNAPRANSARRHWLLAGVGLAAACGGAGVAWWRRRDTSDIDPAAAERFWRSSFDTLQGGPLAMAAFRGKPLLVNFWATWCAPCVEEMPMLDVFYRQHAPNGWQTVGLAIDQPSSVRKFLQRTPVTFPIGLAGLEGTELTRVLGNDAGGLPFSVLFAADGSLRQRRIGRVSEVDLQQWAA